MRLSTYPINTLRDVPADAEVVSHQLMLRASLIRRLAAGLYTWLPIGLRVLRKVETIVREEMNRAGALELLMPTMQPAELWLESGRWDQFGPELLRITDRHERSFCYGPTHEEVITDIARRELKSYRQLPVNFYQIQTKFRDEIRPAFRRHARARVHDEGRVFVPPRRCLARCRLPGHVPGLHADLRAHAVEIPRRSRRHGQHRRQCLAGISRARGFGRGRDRVLRRRRLRGQPGDGGSRWRLPNRADPPPQPLQKVATPGVRTIAELAAFLKVPASRCLKTLLVEGTDGDVVALIVRGDHELNAVKAQKLPGVLAPLRMASAEHRAGRGEVRAGLHRPRGPRDEDLCRSRRRARCRFRLRRQRARRAPDRRQLGPRPAEGEVVDLRNVVPGDPSPTGNGQLRIARGIEVGHIFQLGRKYSTALNATVLDEQGKAVPMAMGCYGIGVTRVVAAAIEQNHDEKGIIWPEPIAPFDVSLIPINMQKSPRVQEIAERLYADLTAAGFDAVLDDRDARPGVKFADDELLGIPHRIVIGDKGLDRGVLEYKRRRDGEAAEVPVAGVIEFLREKCGQRRA